MEQLVKRLRISETAIIMCGSIMVLFVCFAIVGLFVTTQIYPFERPLPFVLGLLLGCALSVSKVILLEKSFERTIDLDSGSSTSYASLMSIMRYMITAGVLLLVFIFRNTFGLFGAIAGILCLQFSAYITAYVLRKRDTYL